MLQEIDKNYGLCDNTLSVFNECMNGMRYAEAIKIVKEHGNRNEIACLYLHIVKEKSLRGDRRNAAFMAAEAVKDSDVPQQAKDAFYEIASGFFTTHNQFRNAAELKEYLSGPIAETTELFSREIDQCRNDDIESAIRTASDVAYSQRKKAEKCVSNAKTSNNGSAIEEYKKALGHIMEAEAFYMTAYAMHYDNNKDNPHLTEEQKFSKDISQELDLLFVFEEEIKREMIAQGANIKTLEHSKKNGGLFGLFRKH